MSQVDEKHFALRGNEIFFLNDKELARKITEGFFKEDDYLNPCSFNQQRKWKKFKNAPIYYEALCKTMPDSLTDEEESNTRIRKADELIKNRLIQEERFNRKRFWKGVGIGLAVAFLFGLIASLNGDFLIMALFIAPLLAGILAVGGARGAGAGFLTLFFWGLTLIVQTGCLRKLAGFFPIGDVAMGGFFAALIIGIGFGIWPGSVFGLIGGLFGKLFKKPEQMIAME